MPHIPETLTRGSNERAPRIKAFRFIQSERARAQLYKKTEVFFFFIKTGEFTLREYYLR